MNGGKNSATNFAIRRHPTWLMAVVGGLLASLLLPLAVLLLLRRRSTDRLRWYRIVYRLAYRLGLSVWQRPTPAADLVALIEGPAPLPPGRALDLGCGTGTDSIYLATRGWNVTGIDMVPQALATARRRATAAGVAPRFIEADVTRLDDSGAGDGYTLLLDFGCLHTLPEDQRPAYVAGVSRAARPGATLLLYGFRRPPRAAPMHAGLTPNEVEQRFTPAGWKLVSADRSSAESIRTAVDRADERFELWRYRLHRASI